jgi:uncharacterized protein YciI
MTVALFCHVDPVREVDRLALRLAHLEFIAAEREQIIAGGPILSAAGAPETMVLLVDFPDVEVARAWLGREPYTANGVFDRIEARRWARVLPEAEPGALDAAVTAEREKPR